MSLFGTLSTTIDYGNFIRFCYNRLIGASKKCVLQFISENGEVDYQEVTVRGPSLFVHYATNNETDYSWKNMEERFRFYGLTIEPGFEVAIPFGTLRFVKYSDPIFGDKLGFIRTSIFI